MAAQLDAFQVVADVSRRQMLRLLSEKSLTINGLASHFEMSRPAVSKHIRILENAGFISVHTIGRERHCILRQDGFKQLQEWMKFFDEFWLTKLTTLELLLKNKAEG